MLSEATEVVSDMISILRRRGAVIVCWRIRNCTPLRSRHLLHTELVKLIAMRAVCRGLFRIRALISPSRTLSKHLEYGIANQWRLKRIMLFLFSRVGLINTSVPTVSNVSDFPEGQEEAATQLLGFYDPGLPH